MKNNREIQEAVYDAVREINEQVDEKMRLELSNHTILIGDGSMLDSIGLVTLIVTAEQNIEDRFDVSLTLADEKAMSQKQSPFRTIGSLIGYIEVLLNDENK
jgi:acyl carrier protein